jgi:hypothetical protein
MWTVWRHGRRRASSRWASWPYEKVKEILAAREPTPLPEDVNGEVYLILKGTRIKFDLWRETC